VKRSASTCSRKASPAGSGQLLDAGGRRWRGHQGDAEEAAPVAWVTGVQGFDGLVLWILWRAVRRDGVAVGVPLALARHETSHASAACPFGLFGRALDFSYGHS